MLAYLFRVLLLFAAISVIRSVVQAFLRGFRGSGGPRAAAGPTGSGPSESDGSTLLHQDPVCGTYVAAGSSLRRIVKGRVIHFCSEACRDRYQG